MPSFNSVIIVGNLTRDPELLYTPKGTAVAEICLAVNEKSKGSDGQQYDETVFVDVTIWGRTAENVNKYLTKGSACLVSGKLKLDAWEDKNTGQKRSKLKVVGLFVQFLGSPQGGSREGDQTRQESRQDYDQSPQGSRQPEDPTQASYWEEDDVPF